MRKIGQAILLAVALLGPASVVLHGGEAAASVAYDSPYTYEQTFGTAMRLLRVDLGCKITEKDPEGGYLLFEYTSPESGKRVHKGSVEVVRSRAGSHVSVQLGSLPRYHEQMIVDALVKKLAADHGEPTRAKPPASPPPPPAAPPEDAGAPDAR